jgi:hypothetical protein
MLPFRQLTMWSGEHPRVLVLDRHTQRA